MASECDIQIPLRVSNNRAYVWDVNDIATIRSKHNICGVLTGTLPHLSQQNVFLGIPLVLMPEEAVLLVDKGFAVLIDDQSSHVQPSTEELQRWNAERRESIKHQIACADAKGAKEAAPTGRAMTEAAIQKRKEREEKRAREAVALDNLEPSVSSLSSPKLDPRSETPTLGAQDNSQSSYTIIVPASSSFDWYKPDACTYPTIASAKAAGIWTYPGTLQERAKCGVFRGLWEQGYFMGGGIKFGGDYLVYPGDPLRYHSHFVASVLDSPTSRLRPMEIVAHGRLGTATKKSHLLCGWDDEKQEVSYFSIEWAGFG